MEDFIIEVLVKIGNTKRVMEICDPNIFCPQTLKDWMVIRTFKALEILENEWELYQSKRSSLSKTSLPDEGTIHSDT